ncbi:hypothetical protein [Dyadobacter fanqingshengii]|uniref:Resolvase/invertase-type recombinase catalytic domain-containing protein n=1 Tax=Dyadobacter fanqingshengii TaxID=2906443 RepID=A0A9X1TGU2_9BACT|nr:hypothetical protein [Dyadobacter fanqingshengii]MCF0040837.1 hypothetical protein [Dyadobacter fanqingshengii]USJ37429.1 hypothetical protein NFI81_06520 [Dyadobacter fanqingshengii]
MKNKVIILHLTNDKRLRKAEFVRKRFSGKVSSRDRKIGLILDELANRDVILLGEFSRVVKRRTATLSIINSFAYN